MQGLHFEMPELRQEHAAKRRVTATAFVHIKIRRTNVANEATTTTTITETKLNQATTLVSSTEMNGRSGKIETFVYRSDSG